MALYIYQTSECTEDIQKHNCTEDVRKFLEHVLKAQDVRLFDRFPPPYLKKRFARQERLIADLRKVGEHTVICCLRLLIRSSNDYAHFKREPVNYGRRYLAPLVNEQTLSGWLEEQTRVKPIAPLPPPNELQQGHLYGVFTQEQGQGNEIVVCESAEWVARISAPEFTNAMQGLAESVVRIIEQEKSDACEIGVAGWPDMQILYRYFPHLRRLFLAAPLKQRRAHETSDVRARYKNILAAGEEMSERALLQASVRAYPDLLLYDVDMWADIQKDAEANMALSPEEASLLQSVRQAESVGPRYPLFINGRAGSGKSTMLQYLFADYLMYWLKNHADDGQALPLFLTCGSELLRRSRQVVLRLLTHHHTHMVSTGNHAVDRMINEHQKELEGAFWEFHPFLRQRLGPDSSRNYPSARYINFARFRKAWQQHHKYDTQALRLFGPDLSWHVIRTFIKGMSPDGPLDPDEYAELPEKQRSVSLDRYELIYEKVWQRWYLPMCQQENYWDDQDLVHCLIEQGDTGQRYPVVFCDEAQDFTHLELRYIYTLSAFSSCRVPVHDVGRVPFAFAGDPFQTLNPTGFRWEATKARFVEMVIRALDPEERSGLEDMNYRELSHNYRSSATITALCNTIQAVRAVLFGVTSLNAQTTWRDSEDTSLPAYYDIQEPEVQEQLRREQGLTIIVPCEEGEEVSFVENDRVLNEIVRRDETGVPDNVLSASRAKGLEFQRVVVYGFGRACPEALHKCLQTLAEQGDGDNMLPLQYFLNKVYVAVSRAKKRLFVLDTKAGLEGLWHVAIDVKTQDRLLSRLGRQAPHWQGQLGSLQPGMVEYWSEDRENPVDIAQRYEALGKSQQDPYLLRSAAMRYTNCRQEQKASECRALAMFLEGDYQSAGDEYAKCELGMHALNAYWQGQLYGSIVALCEMRGELRRELQCELATFMQQAQMTERLARLLKSLADACDSPDWLEQCAEEPAWHACFRKIVQVLITQRGVIPRGQWWVQVVRYVRRLQQNGFPMENVDIGLLQYLGNMVETAFATWQADEQQARQRYPRELSETRIGVLEYPATLTDLQCLGRTSDIIAAYEKQSHDLSSHDLVCVADAYYEQKHYARALELYCGADATDGVAKIMVDCIKAAHAEALAAMLSFVEVLVRNQAWSNACDFASKGHAGSTYRDEQTVISSFFQPHAITIGSLFVKLVARRTDGGSPQERDRISKFLVQFLMQRELPWLGVASVQEAGMAIESVALKNDCVKFYEMIQNTMLSAQERDFAARRWVKCLDSLAVHASQRGNESQARMLLRRAEEHMHALGISSIGVIPERELLPKLSYGEIIRMATQRTATVVPARDVKTQESPARERTAQVPHVTHLILACDAHGKDVPLRIENKGHISSWQLGDLVFEYARTQHRINITHRETYDTSAIKINARECQSNDVAWERDAKNARQFMCKKWNVRCDFSDIASAGILRIYNVKQAITLSVKVAGK